MVRGYEVADDEQQESVDESYDEDGKSNVKDEKKIKLMTIITVFRRCTTYNQPEANPAPSLPYRQVREPGGRGSRNCKGGGWNRDSSMRLRG